MFNLFCLLIALLTGCSHEKTTLKVAATATPHAELLAYAKPDLSSEGIELKILIIDDYNIPNRALAEKEVDANFFQHIPFMNDQIKAFHYPITALAPIEIEPMGLYSHTIKTLADLPQKASIAIPNDPSNEGRALILLHQHQVITLDDPTNLQATVRNIIRNPKEITFQEVDAAMLPRVLADVTAAAIPTNFALQAHFNPQDALIREDPTSPYVNIIAIRIGTETDPRLIALKRAMTSEKMRRFILEKYKGAIVPAF